METDARIEWRTSTHGYDFEGDYPTPATIEKAYDDADLNRAIQAYRFFYPTVSGVAMLDPKPRHLTFTAHSDTPYGPMMIDLRSGPFVLELPLGPLMVVAVDVHQRWVADMGLSGPDAGAGGRHLLLPPGHADRVPPNHHLWRSTSNRLFVGVRSLPIGGDVEAAIDRIRTIKVRPLNPPAGWTEPRWVNVTDMRQDVTPLRWETSLAFYKVLHEVIDSEPFCEPYRSNYGELAVLGIAKGRPFDPDARMRRILEKAAQIGSAQMRVEAFAARRPDRAVWPDRKWESSWGLFRYAVGKETPSWLGLRDAEGEYLDGGSSYRLRVPQPVPACLFWSVTVYDAETRSEIRTPQGRAALRSLFELKSESGGSRPIDLFFGPSRLGREQNWIETLPGKGWFATFRIYGPEPGAFDGSWKPGDFDRVEV